MNKLFAFLIFLMFICPFSLYAYGDFFYNPGIKVGWEFGKNGGLVIGFEGSVGQILGSTGDPFYGLVIGSQYSVFKKSYKSYIELETGYLIIGLATGYELNHSKHIANSMRYRVFIPVWGFSDADTIFGSLSYSPKKSFQADAVYKLIFLSGNAGFN